MEEEQGGPRLTQHGPQELIHHAQHTVHHGAELCSEETGVNRSIRVGPSLVQRIATFSLNYFLWGPRDRGRADNGDGQGDTQVGGMDGLELEVSESRVGGAEGQLHGPPQNTLEDAGGIWGHIPEARWGVGTRSSPEETNGYFLQGLRPPLPSR